MARKLQFPPSAVLAVQEIGIGYLGNLWLEYAVLSARSSSPVRVNFPPEGVFVLESRHRRDFRMAEAAHDYWKILMVFRGKGGLVEGAGRHFNPLAKGDVILVPPRTRHWLEDSKDAPLSLYAICLHSGFLGTLPSGIGLSGNIRIHSRPTWGRELSHLLRSLLIEQGSSRPEKAAWITGLAWQIVGLLWRAQAGKPKVHLRLSGTGALSLQRVKAYAESLPREFHKEDGINDAAERLGLSRRRFTQLFREATGSSWLQVIGQLRLRHAQRLLRETDRSVAAVAFESGFGDLTHFYRTFRKSHGASPEAWRKSKRVKYR